MNRTLHQIKDGEIILKIAIDLGIDTPDFIPSIPVFKNKLKISYEIALHSFENSIKQVDVDPSTSIGLANTTLESILKHILENSKTNTKWKEGDTAYKLSIALMNEFCLNENETEFGKLGQALKNAIQAIESI